MDRGGDLRAFVEALRSQRAVSVADLRLLLKWAANADVPPDLEEDIVLVRSVIGVVDVYEAAVGSARCAIDEDKVDIRVIDELERILESWRALGDIKGELTSTNGSSLAAMADLITQGRTRECGALCDVLLDKAVELKTALYRRAVDSSDAASHSDPVDIGTVLVFEERLQSLCEKGWVRRCLEDLGIEPPGGADDKEALSPSPGPVSTKPSRAETSVPAPDETAIKPAAASQKEPDVGGCDLEAAVARVRRASGDDIAALAESPAAENAVARQAPVSAAAYPASDIGGPVSRPEAENFMIPIRGQAPRPVRKVPPAEPAERPASVPFRAEPAEAGPVTPPARGNAETQKQKHRKAFAGTPELWHAIHVGDAKTLRRCIADHSCNAQMRDASGHSALWHLIAFGHFALAEYFLETFPFGSDGGADATETHAKRGDTFLHVLCRSKSFGAEVAGIFRKIAAAVSEEFLLRRNSLGATFVHLAAAQLNFWVLKFANRNFPASFQRLVCAEALSGVEPPLGTLVARVAKPKPLPTPHAMPPPRQQGLAMLLSLDPSTGSVPYADVAFEVGPAGGPATSRAMILAHRVVVGARSPVLLEELRRLPVQTLPQQESLQAVVFRVDPRIPKDVWKCALTFLYTGEVRCPFAGDAALQLELLRACVLYQLPSPLTRFAQAALVGLLSSAPPQLSLQAFSIAAGSVARQEKELIPIYHAGAYWLCRGAHSVLSGMRPEEMSAVLEHAVQAVEEVVFRASQTQA